jgi:nucleotide-binding universal stress UspA family protein
MQTTTAATFISQGKVMAVLAHDTKGVASSAPPDRRSIHRVLVAFDGSEGAWAALRQAIEVALEQRALLTIAGVVEQPTCSFAGMSPVAIPYTPDAMRRDAERHMQQQLAAARDEVPAAVSVTTRILHGRAVPVLTALAESGNYDLVVTGPRPVGRLRRLLGGSVTHGLLSRSKVSVLAVKAP